MSKLLSKRTFVYQAGVARLIDCFELVTGRSWMDTSDVGVVSNGSDTSYTAIQAINFRTPSKVCYWSCSHQSPASKLMTLVGMENDVLSTLIPTPETC